MKRKEDSTDEQIIQRMEVCSTNEFRDVFFRLLKKAQIGENAEYVVLTIRNKSERIYLNNVLTKGNRSNDSEIDPQRVKAKILFDDFVYLMEFMYGKERINNFVNRVQTEYPDVIRMAQQIDGGKGNESLFSTILRFLLIVIKFLQFIDPSTIQDIGLDNILDYIPYILDVLPFIKNLILEIISLIRERFSKNKDDKSSKSDDGKH